MFRGPAIQEILYGTLYLVVCVEPGIMLKLGDWLGQGPGPRPGWMPAQLGACHCLAVCCRDIVVQGVSMMGTGRTHPLERRPRSRQPALEPATRESWLCAGSGSGWVEGIVEQLRNR